MLSLIAFGSGNVSKCLTSSSKQEVYNITISVLTEKATGCVCELCVLVLSTCSPIPHMADWVEIGLRALRWV